MMIHASSDIALAAFAIVLLIAFVSLH